MLRGIRAKLASLCAVTIVLAGLGVIEAPSASAIGLETMNFTATSAIQTWSIPTGVQSMQFEITGGAGGDNGESGAGSGDSTTATTVTGTLTIPSGVSALDISVGVQGAPAIASNAGGWPNGGNGGPESGYQVGNNGAGGGGSSDIRAHGAQFLDAYVIAGGAGGSGNLLSASTGGAGGYGGLASAGAGQIGAYSDAGAGGQGAVIAAGAPGGEGQTAANSNNGGGGGGGGGFHSGAGGATGTADSISFRLGGGGGGGGGDGTYDPRYVTGISESADGNQGSVNLTFLSVLAGSIPTLTVGQYATWGYSAGSGVTYSIVDGSLPPGLTLDGDTGDVQGVPTEAGNFSFVVAASTYPDGVHAITTNTAASVSVNGGGPAQLAATSATNIGTTSATANGSVLPGGAEVSGIGCAYSTTNPGGGAISGTTATASPNSASPNSTGSTTSVSCSLTGLLSNQLYYYQIVGTQSGSTVRSGTASFTTGSSPALVSANAATNVTTTSATGSGLLSATQNVSSIQCRSANTLSGVASGTIAAASPATSTGIVFDQSLSCSMGSLTPNSIYYYAFQATDSYGTSTSPTVERFITRVSPPWLGSISAGDIGNSSAVISGTVTPTNERVTAVYCRYIASPGNPARGTAVAASPFRVASTANSQSVACDLTGLSPSTTYLVRMEATDRDGTASAPNIVSFTTAGPDLAAPGAPEKPTAVAGPGSATVTVVAPTSGGAPSSYAVTSTPDAKSCVVTAPATSCVVSGLRNGTSYTFTATATNSGGTSIASPPSDPVTPSKLRNAPVSKPKFVKTSKIKRPGKTVVLAHRVKLDSGAYAKPRVRFVPIVRDLLHNGDATRLGSYAVKKHGKVVIHLYTSKPVKITLTLRAKGNATYRPYKSVKSWSLK